VIVSANMNTDTWLAYEVAYWIGSVGPVVCVDVAVFLSSLISNRQNSAVKGVAPEIAYLTLNEIYNVIRFFAPHITDCSTRARLN